MTFRVAVASTDGKFINQHFGKADKFLVFDIKGPKDFEFVELRENDPSCGIYRAADGKSFTNDTIKLLSDCKVVIVSQIGPGASQKLKNSGTMPLIYPDFIEKALIELSQNLDEFT
ncbi:NifB/NifX family molybdenum-iron cluster-binding protein [Methanobacterium alcaliphilum]|uniref:NifB/NifX family molybdenum-iron cluster-binding protein n=1 Tax=Methanobacterium alcaliphilum TaxID=392018 RepID=UPI00200A13A2|nr:NifB/NifX family molybdenum-iron cluster-binding protein [Methanobacterium alcaliphilum]MCK9150677.1 dinitrogenase iron-molybdenum cofactor biosynthesis protein [Methanobacterium alcaliphilum]